MLARLVVLAVLLGWVLSSTHLVAATDEPWWKHMFGPGGSDDAVNPKKNQAVSTSSTAIRNSSNSSSSSSSSESRSSTGSGDSSVNSKASTTETDRTSRMSQSISTAGSPSFTRTGLSSSAGSSRSHSADRDADQDDAGDSTISGDDHPPAAGLDPEHLEDDWESLDSSCPRANFTRLPGACFVLRRVCLHQEAFVTHDWRYSFANPRREKLPDMPYIENWNFPAAVGTNTDALKGRGPRYPLFIRQASAVEPIAALRNPVFTNCTLPLILVVDFLYNMGEFFAKYLTALDKLSQAFDEKVTLVLATPLGLDMAAFHSLFMMPYSRYPAITAAELGARGCADSDPRVGGGGATQGSVPWSGEPSRPHCFQRVVICKWELKTGGGSPLAEVASRVVSTLVGAELLPPSPVHFPGGGGGSSSRDMDPDVRGTSTLRVLIESRLGPVRSIKNMEELLEACRKRDHSGFIAGRFRHLACAATSFSDPDGSVNRKRFLSNVAAVRSAHVLVVLHGAGATNSWFMRQGSSALIELRPCGFGTHFGTWPDKYMPKQHERNDDVIRFFALNVEDPAQCLKGDIETSLRNHTAHRDNVGWDAAYFARDQHLVLKPGPFLEFVRHVGELLLDVEQYRAVREANRLHAYVVPEGLLYAPLSIYNLTEYRATEHPDVLLF